MSFFSETNGFFIKHVQSRKCIYDTGVEYSRYPRNNPVHLTYYLNLTKNCFDSTAQFKFHQSGSILKPNREGCLVGEIVLQDLFLIYEKKGDITASCNARYALNQTLQGGIFTSDFNKCAVPSGFIKRHVYMGMAKCNDEEDQRFHFGKKKFLIQRVHKFKLSLKTIINPQLLRWRLHARPTSSTTLSSSDSTMRLQDFTDKRVPIVFFLL